MTSMLPDRPALGAYRNTPESEADREHRLWLLQMSIRDFRARRRALTKLISIYNGIRSGRRLDIVACDLSVLAAELDSVTQPTTGGWPLRGDA